MGRRLSFGYLYDFRNPPQWQKPWQQLYGEVLDVIAETERLGFEGVWVPEHHCTGDGYMPSPNVILAAIAARTSKIRMGSGVGLAPLYNPVRFAEDCAVLSCLSGGRLEMSLAIGYRKREAAAVGVDFTKRGRIFDEFLEIVQRLWAGETVTFSGRHFQVEGAEISPLPEGGKVPLYLGGFADKALARVARFADGYFGNEEFVAPYKEKLADLGKDPADARVRLQGLFVNVAHDPEQAMEELAPYYHYVNEVYAGWAAEDRALGMDNTALQKIGLEEFKKSGILQIWTPEQAIEKFTRLKERLPELEHYTFLMPAGMPPDRCVAYARVFSEEVMPAVV